MFVLVFSRPYVQTISNFCLDSCGSVLTGLPASTLALLLQSHPPCSCQAYLYKQSKILQSSPVTPYITSRFLTQDPPLSSHTLSPLFTRRQPHLPARSLKPSNSPSPQGICTSYSHVWNTLLLPSRIGMCLALSC